MCSSLCFFRGSDHNKLYAVYPESQRAANIPLPGYHSLPPPISFYNSEVPGSAGPSKSSRSEDMTGIVVEDDLLGQPPSDREILAGHNSLMPAKLSPVKEPPTIVTPVSHPDGPIVPYETPEKKNSRTPEKKNNRTPEKENARFAVDAFLPDPEKITKVPRRSSSRKRVQTPV
jgi:hypothetical protein